MSAQNVDRPYAGLAGPSSKVGLALRHSPE